MICCDGLFAFLIGDLGWFGGINYLDLYVTILGYFAPFNTCCLAGCLWRVFSLCALFNLMETLVCMLVVTCDCWLRVFVICICVDFGVYIGLVVCALVACLVVLRFSLFALRLFADLIKLSLLYI